MDREQTLISSLDRTPVSVCESIKSETKRATVAVVDLQWLGSLPTFHLVVVESLRALGCRVVSLSPEPGEVLGHCRASGQDSSGLAVRRIGAARVAGPTRTRAIRGTDLLRTLFRRHAPAWIRAKRLSSLALSGWESVRDEISAFRWENGDPIDQVIFPYLDHPVISLLSGCADPMPDLDRPWTGLWVHPDPRPPARRQLQSVAQRLNLFPNFAGLWSLDEGLSGWADGVYAPSWLGRFPDVTNEELREEPGQLESELLRIGAKGPVVLLAGELSARKGIYELLGAAREAMRTGSCLQFVVAGPLDQASCDREVDSLGSALDEAPANTCFLPGWIPDGHEFNAAIRGSAVVWAAYRDFPFSSNLLTKASLVQRPVLVNQGGLLADRVRAHNLGQEVDASDASRVVVALESLADPEQSEERAFSSYFKGHSRLGLKAVLNASIPLAVASVRSDRVSGDAPVNG